MLKLPYKILAVVLSLSALCWCWFELSYQNQASRAAVRELGDCQKLANEIEVLRKQNNLVLSVAEPNHDVTEDVLSALKSCQINQNFNLAAVSMGQVEETDFAKKSIDEPIRGEVTLQQLIQFLMHVDSLPVTYFTDEVRLTRPTRASASTTEADPRKAEEWTASFRVYYFERM